LARVDVTIMGAGIFGLSIAWACLKKGASVRIIDPNGIGKRASGGLVGALAPHVPERWNDKLAFQFDSLIMAQGFWDEVEKISGLSSGYGRLGRLQPIANERGLALARARIEGAKMHWQGHAIWEVVAADTFGDWAPQSATGWLVRDTLSARMNPRNAAAALAAAISIKGGEIAKTGNPEGRVVWATGVAGLEELSTAFGRDMGSGEKGQGLLLKYDACGLPQLFSNFVHIVPHDDGTVAIGSTSERYFEAPDSTDAQLDEVLEKALAGVPVLQGAPVIARWAGLRPRSATRAPVLGAHPLKPDQFIANGGFKIGFGVAPKIGHVMADLMLDGVDAIPEKFRASALVA